MKPQHMNEAAWQHGYRDGELGLPKQKPYPAGSIESWSYSAGWIEGDAARRRKLTR